MKRRNLTRLLESGGFISQGEAKHDKYLHPDGRWTEVPRHKEIDERLAARILRQAGFR
jgi:predicted RNA binding protein YcfA (HicA-like mRNA interferase family)